MYRGCYGSEQGHHHRIVYSRANCVLANVTASAAELGLKSAMSPNIIGVNGGKMVRSSFVVENAGYRVKGLCYWCALKFRRIGLTNLGK